ncbi:MAG TPA: hypothetical protein VFC46_08825 [Humisphaera sp.]|nr:hypothetical protein [Humisphaera sp.]
MKRGALFCVLMGSTLVLLGVLHAAEPDVGAKTPATPPATTANDIGVPDRPVPSPEKIPPRLRNAIDLLRVAPTVESYRIMPTRGEDSSQGVLGYKIIARGSPLDEMTVRKLTRLVFDPRAFKGDTWCGDIEPGVAFRFVGDSHVLTILICFKCEELELWLDGKSLGKRLFIGVQPEMLQLVQHVFPNDETLRAIPVSETYGRIYLISAIIAAPAKLSVDQRTKIISDWMKKVENAVGEPAEWIDNGGTKYSSRATDDGNGIVVIINKKGHDTIASLTGVEAQSP